VRAENRWVKFDALPVSAAQNQRLAAYHRLRDKYRETVEDQLALAAWCKKSGLQDQWRAHLSNVLVLNPDHKEARTLLGYQQAEGIWLTSQEVSGSKARAAAALAAINKWKPKLLAIRSGLKQGDANRRDSARKALADVQDAAAIPALEVVFCADSEPMALLGVDQFAEMSVADASLALVRQALFSPWPAVCKAAVEKLKARDRETFVPDLLAAMSSPTECRMELFQEPDGRLLCRSGQGRDGPVVLDTTYESPFAPYVVPASGGSNYNPGTDTAMGVGGSSAGGFLLHDGAGPGKTYVPVPSQPMPSGMPIEGLQYQSTQGIGLGPGPVPPGPPVKVIGVWWWGPGLYQAPVGQGKGVVAGGMAVVPRYVPPKAGPAVGMPNRARAQAQDLAREQAQEQNAAWAQSTAIALAQEAAVERGNAQAAALDAPFCRLLAATTSVNLPLLPEPWSQWWADTDKVYLPRSESQDSVGQKSGPMQKVLAGAPAGPVPFGCLAAGTTVWTDAGPVAVEQIKVGDRVLAQHPETGELAYKPVLHTTTRLYAELVKLELVDDTVTCSAGHRFWIAGTGWVKARDIRPRMNFHGAAGTTPLRRSEPAGVGPVYNLIVADFHGYFVGKAMIYSRDITARKSNLLVPGLPRQ
jgi:hypothetical protein